MRPRVALGALSGNRTRLTRFQRTACFQFFQSARDRGVMTRDEEPGSSLRYRLPCRTYLGSLLLGYGNEAGYLRYMERSFNAIAQMTFPANALCARPTSS